MTAQDLRRPVPPSREARPTTGRPRAWLRTARPWQWHKNLLVFAAPAAAGLLTDGPVLLATAIAAVAFTLAAAGTYFVNDAVDAPVDARHPVKCQRPIACGLLDRRLAAAVGVALQAGAVLFAWLLTGAGSALVVAAYAALTLAYSTWLKRVPVVELLAVAAGFVLRAVGGGVAADVRISLWFIVVTSAGALFLAVGKRTAEHQLLGTHRASHRRVLGVYTEPMLRTLLFGSAAVTLASFALWSLETWARGLAPGWTPLAVVPLAILLGRYAWLAQRGRGGEPELLLVRDRVLVGSGGLLGLLLFVGLHLP